MFASAIIKKHRFWPKDVNREMINAHFEDSPVGHTNCFWMNLYEDNSKIGIYSFIESDYTMMLMSTYGTLERVGNNQSWTWKSDNTEHQTTFVYPELIQNHFQYYHTVDDHNNRSQSPISLEMTWCELIVCLDS